MLTSEASYNLRRMFISFLVIVLLFVFSGCINQAETPDPSITPSADLSGEIEETPNVERPVIDQSYDFVNSSIFPETDDTQYSFRSPMLNTNPNRIFYGSGTCTFLKGKKIVALFFTDDDVSKWGIDEINTFTEKNVLPALDYIEKQAKEYNVDISFEIWRFSAILSKNSMCTYDGTVNPELFNGGSTKDMFAQVAEELGYSCEMALHWALNKKADDSDVIPMFILNKSGTSYARNQYTVSESANCEHAVVFAGRSNGKNDKCATFVHELLHLYGAEELYKPENRYELALELYPNDIMCLETRNMSKLKIEAFTAYTLGWTHKKPDICDNKMWYENESSYENYYAIING